MRADSRQAEGGGSGAARARRRDTPSAAAAHRETAQIAVVNHQAEQGAPGSASEEQTATGRRGGLAVLLKNFEPLQSGLGGPGRAKSGGQARMEDAACCELGAAQGGVAACLRPLSVE